MRNPSRRNPDILELSSTQLSTDEFVPIAGTEVDTADFAAISYTLRGFIAAVDFRVIAANLPDFSDGSQQIADTVSADGTAQYGTFATFRFYRVEVASAVNAVPGVVNVNALLKKQGTGI